MSYRVEHNYDLGFIVINTECPGVIWSTHTNEPDADYAAELFGREENGEELQPYQRDYLNHLA